MTDDLYSIDEDSFKKDTKKPLKFSVLFFAFILTFILELAILIFTLDETIPLGAAALAHFGYLFFLSSGIYYLNKKNYDLNFPVLLVALTTTASVFGTLICIVTLIGKFIFDKSAVAFSEWFKAIFPEDEIEETEELYERLILGWDNYDKDENVIPFNDIIELGTVGQKQIVLAKITQHYRPDFAGVLLRAIKDPVNSIRVQAATAITKIEHKHSDKIIDFEKRLASPNANPKYYRLLAIEYDQLANCGLLDEDRANEMAMKAIENNLKFLKHIPSDQPTMLSLAKLYLQQDMFEDAYKYYAECVKTSDFETTPKDAIFGYLETLFNMKKYKEIRSFVNKNHAIVNILDSRHEHIKDIIEFWSGNKNNREVTADK